MISAENLINTKLRKIFLFCYKVSLQKFIEAVFVYTFFYNLRNVGPNTGSPMNYRFFCNRIIFNGKVRIKYLSRIMLINCVTLHPLNKVLYVLHKLKIQLFSWIIMHVGWCNVTPH